MHTGFASNQLSINSELLTLNICSSYLLDYIITILIIRLKIGYSYLFHLNKKKNQIRLSRIQYFVIIKNR